MDWNAAHGWPVETYCPLCLTMKPWYHDADNVWRVRLRKAYLFVTGKWKLELTWLCILLAGCAGEIPAPPEIAPAVAPGEWDSAALTRVSHFGCERAVWQLPGESLAQVVALYSRGYLPGDCLILRPAHGGRSVWVHYVFFVECEYETISTDERHTVGCAGVDDQRVPLRPDSEDAPLFYADDWE